MSRDFQVKLADFEGPIGALLGLIEEKKLHINQVSLATVADSFIAHLQNLPEASKSQMADFIFVASTLMLIKSVSLLPTLKLTSEETASVADLERRLMLYQKMKELSGGVRAAYGRRIIFSPEPRREETVIFSPSRDLTLANLTKALQAVIASFPKVEKLPQAVIKKVLSLEEAIADLTRRVSQALKTSFRELTRDKAEKVNVVVSFLGLLELFKQGIVNLEQGAPFQDIAVESVHSDIPKYG